MTEDLLSKPVPIYNSIKQLMMGDLMEELLFFEVHDIYIRATNGMINEITFLGAGFQTLIVKSDFNLNKRAYELKVFVGDLAQEDD